jgi:hypothetical protein
MYGRSPINLLSLPWRCETVIIKPGTEESLLTSA